MRETERQTATELIRGLRGYKILPDLPHCAARRAGVRETSTGRAANFNGDKII